MNIVKKLLRSVGFLAGLAVILTVTSILIKPKSAVYNAVGVDNKTKDLNKEEEQSIDLVFFGDSESYSAFNPLQMFSEQGYTSYSCGTSLQRLCDTYVLLEKILSKQSPSVVVLETNCLFRSSGVEQDDDDAVMRTFSKIIPVLKYHDRWKTYVPININVYSDKNDSRFKGFRYRTESEPYTGGQWMHETDKVSKISDDTKEYLGKIKDYVESKGATLMLVSSPSPLNWTYSKHNAVQALAEEYELEFLDMNLLQDELDIDWTTETKDGGNHLNFEGAKKVSAYLGKYLSEKYSLPDHRDDSAYDKWKEDVENSGMDI